MSSLHVVHQNHCMTFINILVVFFTSWKSCLKEQWPNKYLFQTFWLNAMICESRPKKRVEYIWVPEIMIEHRVLKGHNNYNIFSVFGELFKSLSSKQSKLNFWNWLHKTIAFLCHLLTQTVTWRPNCTILTSRVESILKATTNTVFLWQSFGRS